MSKSSTATSQKPLPQLSSKSAWSRGPPQPPTTTASSRSQSPAPTPTTPSAPNAASNVVHGTHSRRPSTLGQGVPIKEGVSVPRNIAAAKGGSAVTFGSIDDASATISSSPASAPVVKPADGVKSFGSNAVQNGASVATSKLAMTSRSVSTSSTAASSPVAPAPTSTPSPAPKMDRKAIAKLFQGSSAPSPQPPPPAELTPSPATRPSNLPPAAHQPGGSYPPPPFQPGGSTLRPQPPNGSPAGAQPPRSPSYSRPPMANGQSGGIPGRPPSGPTSAPGAIPPAMPSPRMSTHPPPGQPAGMAPPPNVAWPAYYYPQYPGMPPEGMYPYAPAWAVPQQMPPHHPHQQPPHHPPGAPAPGMPMSPRNAPPALQPTPSTPTLSHAQPVVSHGGPPPPPPPQVHVPPSASVASPPPTPNGAARLNSSASAFVPGKKILAIKSQDGRELNIEALRRSGQSPVLSPGAPSPVVVKSEPKRQSVRIESPEQKERRMAEQRQAEEAEKARVQRVEREAREAKEAAERKEREEKEEQERKEREEREAKEREEREKLEAEEKAKAEAERVKREAEEAAERERQEAEERKRKAAEAEEARLKKEAEERERKEAEEKARQEAEEKAKKEAEEKAAAAAAEEEAKAKAAAAESEEKEEGEIIEDKAATSTKDKDASLRIDTVMPPPAIERRRPGPLDLKNVNTAITPSLPSALATARRIDDINSVSYPEGIKSPKVELNVNAMKGKFRYDRDFLLQFMAVCKEKPDNLPPLDAIGLEPSDQTFGMTRGGSGRSRVSSLQTPSSARNPGIGLGFIPSSLGKSSGSTFAGMGNFSTTASKLSSEERFAMSNNASRSASIGGAPTPGGVPGRAPPMVRTSSQGGPNDRRRTRSQRGQTRGESARHGAGAHPSQAPPQNMQPPFEPVAPLEQTANRWVPTSTKRQADSDSPELVDRKVKALLNKLTMERFDSISDQIIGWANKSEKEKNGQTLIQVIRLVFEKATDEATFSEMYARLCRKMMEQISTKVTDDGILNAEGKPFAGGQLFRKYLLNRCQEDFERGWNQKETTAAAAAVKATEDKAVKDANEKGDEDGKAPGEVELYSEEYYAAAKAKRRGLGLIRFIGELFKLQMLTERIMHECIKKLLGNVENPEEEEIESLCKLLSTVGQLLDTPKARAHMDVYFSRMKELTKSKNVNSRMTFMLQDVIELRSQKWIPRNQIAAPTTIAQIHEAAAKEKAQAEKDAANMRSSTMSRGGSRRGGDRGDGQVVGPDGWAVAGSSTAPRPQPKAGDLSQFGKIAKAGGPMTFGPSSVFQKTGKDAGAKGREASVSRQASSRNMFDMLSNTDMATEPPAGKSSRPPSRKPSADFTQTGVPEAPQQRKRLNLLPRSKPVEENKSEEPVDPEDDDEDEESSGPSMGEDEAKRKIDEDIKELFSLRSLDEAESYFASLPADYHWLFVDKLVNKAIDGKAADIPLVRDLLQRANDKDLASSAALEKGFEGLAEIIDDIAIDVPKAFNNMADWIKAAGLGTDPEQRARIASKVPESGDKLLALLET